MSLLHALVLGIVQGLTEFLPISSKGHLVLVPFIAGWPTPTLAFDVAVHVGTLASVVWVFRERIGELIAAVLGRGGRPGDRRLVMLLAIGTIPAAVFGAVFKDRIEGLFQRPVVTALFLAATGWWLLTVENYHQHRKQDLRDDSSLGPADAGVIGLAQAAALLPGISRSGSTIGAGMALGFTREAAIRFSFLLAIPIIVGAAIVQIPDIARQGASGDGAAIAIGVITSAITGVVAIKLMLGVVARRGLRPFGIYCFVAMAAGLLAALARG